MGVGPLLPLSTQAEQQSLLASNSTHPRHCIRSKYKETHDRPLAAPLLQGSAPCG